MNELKVNYRLSINLEELTILLDHQEIGYMTSSIFENEESLYIFIEEEYRFHRYALDSLRKYFNYTFNNNGIDIIRFYIDSSNRPALNLMGHFNCTYVTFDEEADEHIYIIEKTKYLYENKQKNEEYDAYDKDGNLTGVSYIRGHQISSNHFRKIASVILIDENNQILVSLRHPEKTNPLCYEVTTGLVLKGETPEQACVREAKEETNIDIDINSLQKYNTLVSWPCIYEAYVCFYNSKGQTIQLQEEETIDYTTVSFNEFAELIEARDFSPTNRKIINSGKKKLNEILQKKMEN